MLVTYRIAPCQEPVTALSGLSMIKSSFNPYREILVALNGRCYLHQILELVDG